MSEDQQLLGQALRLLQAGDRVGAVEIAQRLRGSTEAGGRANMIIGIARREEARLDESLFALERAAQRAPDDYAIAFELGRTLEALKRWGPARSAYLRAAKLRPGFAPAHRAAAVASIVAGDFAAAEHEYAAAAAAAPAEAELSQLLAQVQLLRGHLEAGWRSYARRAHRRGYEQHFAQQGARYEPPALAGLAGRRVVILGEQGLGDNLFFLRYARPLARVAAAVEYVGDPRLHSLLARTGLFARLHSDRAPVDLAGAIPVLLGDLPTLDPALAHAHAPSLAITPSVEALERMRARLEAAGPRPWIAVTWRAGVAPETGGLAKQVPVEALFEALRPSHGTVLALQRAPTPDELDRAAAALGRTVHDLSGVNAELEDALALVSLVDRHIAVSNTNVHLAAAAAAVVDVLVQFPPEWRWGLEGPTPWFPAMRLHRQQSNGDWSAALQGLGG